MIVRHAQCVDLAITWVDTFAQRVSSVDIHIRDLCRQRDEHTHTYLYVYIRMYIYIYIYTTHTYIYIYTYIHIYIYVHVYIYTHAYRDLYIFAYMYKTIHTKNKSCKKILYVSHHFPDRLYNRSRISYYALASCNSTSIILYIVRIV